MYYWVFGSVLIQPDYCLFNVYVDLLICISLSIFIFSVFVNLPFLKSRKFLTFLLVRICWGKSSVLFFWNNFFNPTFFGKEIFLWMCHAVLIVISHSGIKVYSLNSSSHSLWLSSQCQPIFSSRISICSLLSRCSFAVLFWCA